MSTGADFRLHFARRPRRGIVDCPSSQDLSTAAAGRGTARVRRRVIEHLTDCPDCGELWQLAATLHGTLRNQPDAARSPRGPWAMAAAVIMALGLSLVGDFNPARQPEPVYRSAAVADVSLESLIPPVLDRRAFSLRWAARADVAVDVRLFDDRLNLLFERYQTLESLVLVPEHVFAGIATGTALTWQLEITGAAGYTTDVLSGSVIVR